MEAKKYISQLSNGEKKQFEFNVMKQKGNWFFIDHQEKKFNSMSELISFFFKPSATPQGLLYWHEVGARKFKNNLKKQENEKQNCK